MTEFDVHYGLDLVTSYINNHAKESLTQAFMLPSVTKFLKSTVPGKKVLDIGCGNGYWSCQAVRHGPKLVEAFDIQQEMVVEAKKITSQFNTVHVQVGDIKNMPYDNNTFDVAMSIYITCDVVPDIVSKHFKELYRVLAPGRKAIVVNLTEHSFPKLYLRVGADEVSVRSQIVGCLEQLPNNPTLEQVNRAFESLQGVIKVFFATDNQGRVYQVNNINQLANGDPVWTKTPIMTFPNYFYKDEFLTKQTIAAGFCIDRVENIYTEERRLGYNKIHSDREISKAVIDYPLVHMYHISKPV